MLMADFIMRLLQICIILDNCLSCCGSSCEEFGEQQQWLKEIFHTPRRGDGYSYSVPVFVHTNMSDDQVRRTACAKLWEFPTEACEAFSEKLLQRLRDGNEATTPLPCTDGYPLAAAVASGASSPSATLLRMPPSSQNLREQKEGEEQPHRHRPAHVYEHFFVEIGTSDFGTLHQQLFLDARWGGLAVEPMQDLLERLPTRGGLYKHQAALQCGSGSGSAATEGGKPGGSNVGSSGGGGVEVSVEGGVGVVSTPGFATMQRVRPSAIKSGRVARHHLGTSRLTSVPVLLVDALVAEEEENEVRKNKNGGNGDGPTQIGGPSRAGLVVVGGGRRSDGDASSELLVEEVRVACATWRDVAVAHGLTPYKLDDAWFAEEESAGQGDGFRDNTSSASDVTSDGAATATRRGVVRQRLQPITVIKIDAEGKDGAILNEILYWYASAEILNPGKAVAWPRQIRFEAWGNSEENSEDAGEETIAGTVKIAGISPEAAVIREAGKRTRRRLEEEFGYTCRNEQADVECLRS
mmetsp:Transcript_70525/g.138654  ORF Transcript_70525/g.138654 Transcript_70525/m.138654 type:complete len:523 (-) Transcript_70525:104-1672(-)